MGQSTPTAIEGFVSLGNTLSGVASMVTTFMGLFETWNN
jgi:hypothetical protein